MNEWVFESCLQQAQILQTSVLILFTQTVAARDGQLYCGPSQIIELSKLGAGTYLEKFNMILAKAKNITASGNSYQCKYFLNV